MTVGDVRILLTGDAEAPEEEWILAHAADLHADILKVAHHGSRTSTTAAFLAAVHPRVAVVSVGAANSYGHPDGPTLAAIAASGAQVLRTDQEGTIVITLDGPRLRATAGGRSWGL